jgi:cell shape-determining protein MreD
MNWIKIALLLFTAWLVVFWQSRLGWFQRWTTTQPDLLPALMVYASLTTSLPAVAALSLVGGLGFDTLSANPLGVSVLPLFLVGFALHERRELILRDQVLAQQVLGGLASLAVPALNLVLLLTLGETPLLHWHSLAQWAVLGITGAAASPLFFLVLDRLARALQHPPNPATSFRDDREIKRGR